MLILKRLASRGISALVVVWAATTIVFFALRATGDPLEAILGGPGSQAGEEATARAREAYGLDRPLPVQYLIQVRRVFTLQFGDSYARKQPVWDLIVAQLPATLILAVLALAVAWLITIVSALVASNAHGHLGRFFRTLLRGLSTVTTVIPEFFLGAVLILIFASTLNWLPATSSGFSPAGLVLPVITLAIPIAGFFSQVMQDSLDAADTSPFALTARARGASDTRVLLSHTLRHACLPVLALSGWAFGSLLSGAVIVESLFGRPGLGRLLIDGASSRDVPLVIAAVALIALLYVVVMFIVDMVEVVVDPRLRPRSREGALA